MKAMSILIFLDVIHTDYFQAELLEAFDALEIGDNKAQRRLVIQEAFKLYEDAMFCRLYSSFYMRNWKVC